MKKLLLIAAITTLAACGGLIEDLKNAAQDAAFNAVLDEAKKNGGTAIRVKGGQAATLEITDAASPIKGAAVEIPAGAIPSSMVLGVLAVQGSADFKFPELTTVGAGAVAPSFVGPVVVVVLKAIEGQFDDKLLKAAVVRLPYGAAVSAEVKDRLYANHILDNPLTELENSKDEAAKSRVSGETLSFSPFAAALRGIPGLIPSPNTLSIKVTKAGAEVCSKSIDLSNVANFTSMGAYTGTAATPNWDVQFNGDGTFVGAEFRAEANLGATDTNIVFGSDVDLSEKAVLLANASIKCDGMAGNGVTVTNGAITGAKFSAKLVSFAESTTCTDPCNHIGDAVVASTLELVEGDVVAQATVSGPIVDMEWYTKPIP